MWAQERSGRMLWMKRPPYFRPTLRTKKAVLANSEAGNVGVLTGC